MAGWRSAGRPTTTDSEGSFQLSGLDPAAYVVTVSLPGYVTAPRDPDVNPIGYYHLGDTARLEMIKGGVITGRVTRATGEPNLWTGGGNLCRRGLDLERAKERSVA